MSFEKCLECTGPLDVLCDMLRSQVASQDASLAKIRGPEVVRRREHDKTALLVARKMVEQGCGHSVANFKHQLDKPS